MVSTAAPASGRQPLLSVSPQLLSADQLIELQSRRSRVIKRSGDIVFSLAVLTLGSPVFLLLLGKPPNRGIILQGCFP